MSVTRPTPRGSSNRTSSNPGWSRSESTDSSSSFDIGSPSPAQGSGTYINPRSRPLTGTLSQNEMPPPSTLSFPLDPTLVGEKRQAPLSFSSPLLQPNQKRSKTRSSTSQSDVPINPTDTNAKSAGYSRWTGTDCQNAEGLLGEDCIVEWLTEAGNYNKWKNSAEIDRKGYATTILDRMTSAGINHDKQTQALIHKVKAIEKKWGEVDKAYNATGNVGAKAKQWKYYDVLKPVFKARPINSPIMMLESGQEDSVSLDEQLGFNSRGQVAPSTPAPRTPTSRTPRTPASATPRSQRSLAMTNNQVGLDWEDDPDPERNPAHIKLMSDNPDASDDDEDNETANRESSALGTANPNQQSPTGSIRTVTSTSSLNSMSAASKNIGGIKGKKAGKGGNATDVDEFSRVLDYGNKLDKRRFNAELSWNESKKEVEERRVRIEEERWKTELDERQAARRMQEDKVEFERNMAKVEAFTNLMKTGAVSGAEARRMIGLPPQPGD